MTVVSVPEVFAPLGPLTMQRASAVLEAGRRIAQAGPAVVDLAAVDQPLENRGNGRLPQQRGHKIYEGRVDVIRRNGGRDTIEEHAHWSPPVRSNANEAGKAPADPFMT